MWFTSSQAYTCLLCLCIFCIGSCKRTCGPGFKAGTGSNQECVQLTNEDILGALHWLSSPPIAPTALACKKINTIQGIDICEDFLPVDMSQCNVWSVITSVNCNHYGSLDFEKHWASRGCQVTIYTYSLLGAGGGECEYSEPADPKIEGQPKLANIIKVTDHPNIVINRNAMWGSNRFASFYKHVVPDISNIPIVNILKIQRREGVAEDLDGVQFTMLADLFLHSQGFSEKVEQVVFTAGINSYTLTDTVGREAEHAWNMWATTQFLQGFASFSSKAEKGRFEPLQFSHLLAQAGVDDKFGLYHHSLIRVTNEKDLSDMRTKLAQWKPKQPSEVIRGRVPPYCRTPSIHEDETMQHWIRNELGKRCHQTRLWVPCETKRTYDGFIPCPQELSDDLAEDYANTMLWCDAADSKAAIPQMVKVDSAAIKAFNQDPISEAGDRNGRVRLAFFFTVYSDEAHVRRLLSRLWSPEHYYLLHVDPTGAHRPFKKAMRALANEYNVKLGSRVDGNVYLASDVPIVYGASTATILLTKAMAWFRRNTRGWDYFVPVTGSDYPLLPLSRMEKIMAYQQPPMPFVMAWTPGTSTHIFRLEKTVPEFETDPELALSIKAVTDERGKVLGAVPMEYRSTNFGPPLLCNNKKSYYFLDNRRNKTRTEGTLDTQWLFPRDKFHGRAYSNWDPNMATPASDGIWRIWKKSDPATSGAYDLESVDYITESVEGRKYYHFFKHMLLGSEEHYYASLLFNWPRTQGFVQTLSAQGVWNTWELGLWEQSLGFLTHTHFLSPNEMPILKGFARRGMLFARKFSSTKTPEVLDMIDNYIHNNVSTDAGLMWPGFFEVDTWSPGKVWVAAHRHNASLKAKAAKRKKLNVRGGRQLQLELLGPVKTKQQEEAVGYLL